MAIHPDFKEAVQAYLIKHDVVGRPFKRGELQEMLRKMKEHPKFPWHDKKERLQNQNLRNYVRALRPSLVAANRARNGFQQRKNGDTGYKEFKKELQVNWREENPDYWTKWREENPAQLTKKRALDRAHSKEWRKKNRAKIRAKRRAEAKAYRAEAAAQMRQNGHADILDDAGALEIAENIANDRSLFNKYSDVRLHNKSLNDLFRNKKICAYIGETKRDLKDEALCWLSLRHSNDYEPVLRWACPRQTYRWKKNKGHRTHIFMTEAERELGFRSVFLWKNPRRWNTTFVEEKLQARYDILGLPRRLHRVVGAGRPLRPQDAPNEHELHKVYLAYSFDVPDAIKKRKVVVIR
jgi:hypothetical protein